MLPPYSEATQMKLLTSASYLVTCSVANAGCQDLGGLDILHTHIERSR